MCDFPITIKNPHYGKPNGQQDMQYIQVPCSKCASCYTRRSNEWYIRLYYEHKVSLSAYFVTLTYADTCVPISYNGWLTTDKTHIQRYIKNIRKKEPKNNNIKYYAVSEYGGEYERPHYHLIIFNVANKQHLSRCWQMEGKPLGNVDIANVEEGSIKYVTGYIGKRKGIPTCDYDDRQKEKALMSKNMGTYYVEKSSDFHKDTLTGYTILNGVKYVLPRYYKNKLFANTKLVHATNADYKSGKITKPMRDKILEELEEQKRIYYLNKISKNNYEIFIKNQDAKAKNFTSYNAWESNSQQIAVRNNERKPHSKSKNSI